MKAEVRLQSRKIRCSTISCGGSGRRIIRAKVWKPSGVCLCKISAFDQAALLPSSERTLSIFPSISNKTSLSDGPKPASVAARQIQDPGASEPCNVKQSQSEATRCLARSAARPIGNRPLMIRLKEQRAVHFDRPIIHLPRCSVLPWSVGCVVL
jgi:hypothetical protein